MPSLPSNFDPFWMFKEGAKFSFDPFLSSVQGAGQRVEGAIASMGSNLAAGFVVDAAFYGLRSRVRKQIDEWRVTELIEYTARQIEANTAAVTMVSQAAFDLMLHSFVSYNHEAVLRNHGASTLKDIILLKELWQTGSLSLKRYITSGVEQQHRFDDSFISPGVNRCTLAFIVNCHTSFGWITDQERDRLWRHYFGSSVANIKAKSPASTHPLGTATLGTLLSNHSVQKLLQYLDSHYAGCRYMTGENWKNCFAEAACGG